MLQKTLHKALLLGIVGWLEACTSHPAVINLEFDHAVKVGGIPLQVAYLDTPLEHQQGLMGVSSLAKNHGALFVFEDEADVRFWMKNTPIPLDMLFFNAEGRLIHMILSAQPCKVGSCFEFPVSQSKYVIETNAGFVEQHQLLWHVRLTMKK